MDNEERGDHYVVYTNENLKSGWSRFIKNRWKFEKEAFSLSICTKTQQTNYADKND